MGKKTNFDDVLKESMSVSSKEQEKEQLIEEFQNFISKDIPKEVEMYEWKGDDTLIEVFKFTPKSDVDLVMGENQESITGHTRYFSIAKVLAAGPEADYEVGQFVKLRDSETLSIENSQYKAWVDNDYSKSNLKQKGKEPMKYVSNIFRTFGSNSFILNPLDLQTVDSGRDEAYYKVSSKIFQNRIKDVKLLINSLT